MKYKVGQRVRVRKDLKKGEQYDKCNVVNDMSKRAGRIVTIALVKEDCERYLIEEDNRIWYWSEEMFEGLVQFTKEDLQDGDIVTDREGCKGFYFDGEFYGAVINDGYLNDELADGDGCKENDIIKVERPVKLETVFEREEEPEKDEVLQKIEELEKQIAELKKECSL